MDATQVPVAAGSGGGPRPKSLRRSEVEPCVGAIAFLLRPGFHIRVRLPFDSTLSASRKKCKEARRSRDPKPIPRRARVVRLRLTGPPDGGRRTRHAGCVSQGRRSGHRRMARGRCAGRAGFDVYGPMRWGNAPEVRARPHPRGSGRVRRRHGSCCGIRRRRHVESFGPIHPSRGCACTVRSRRNAASPPESRIGIPPRPLGPGVDRRDARYVDGDRSSRPV